MKAMQIVFAALLCASGAALARHSPYAGQEQRPIKALSEQEVTALLAGQGAGFAKAAELNGYPGPLHVLELAAPLGSSDAQRAATQRLMTEHKARARSLGAELVEAERALDAVFAQRDASPASADAVDAATRRVGLLHAELRSEHLKTHLAQTALLDTRQVQHYARLRGYAADSQQHHSPGHRH